MRRDPPTPQLLAELLEYDPATGVLTWKPRGTHHFASAASCRTWNTRYANRPAFTGIDAHGYATGAIFDRVYKAHRVAWAIMTEAWPTNDIDHINGERADNRWANLRTATRTENARNSARRSDNTSGVTGVYRRKNGKWAAFINIGGGRIKPLGQFARKSDAIAARYVAEHRYGFHENHGRPQA